MSEILLEYAPSFLKSVGFLLLLPLSRFGLGVFSKISLAFMLSTLIGPQQFSLISMAINLFVGLILSLPIVIANEIVKSLSGLLEVSTGFNFSLIYNPEEKQTESFFGSIGSLVVFYFFLKFHWMEFIELLMQHGQKINTWSIVILVKSYLIYFFKISLPFFAFFALTEIFFGFFQRLLPNLSLTFEIQAFKIFLVINALHVLARFNLLEKALKFVDLLTKEFKQLLN
ncbi:MAG: flagellar biosynthetic protein FliR [Deltaproteobacteria bacterium]|nr:flagellar biosynthetic protein FliR [Deltaproteobacteria bacterium]